MNSQSGPAPTGAEILIDALKREGVDVTFGYPGATVIPIFDALKKAEGIDLLLTRHEQAATHAADGYARATGKTGVCIVTSGPGATNTITGIATAKMDSIPLVIVSGQVSTDALGTDAFQEADMAGLARTLCKYHYAVERIEDLPVMIKNAFHIARTGRPGPVVLDFPRNIMTETLAGYVYPEKATIPSYRWKTRGNATQIDKLAAAVARAERPLILAGGGIITAGAGDELRAFLEKTDIPCAVTMMGLGGFPASHRLNLGMPGMHGAPAANLAIMECDLLIGLGTRFDDRVTSDQASFAAGAVIAHIDIDPSEIGKNVRADIPIVGDVRSVLEDLLARTEPRPANAWNARTAAWKTERAVGCIQDESGEIEPVFVIEAVNRAMKPGTIITTDVGQHQMWAALFLDHRAPRTFLSSGGMGTMGFGLPAAMGAALGKPGVPIVCISGDGSIQMNMQELATCAIHKIPVKIVVLNNSCLGLVRQSQELFWDEVYSKVCLKENASCRGGCRDAEGGCPNSYWPDLVGIAEASGIRGVRITRPSDVVSALRDGFAAEGPVLMEFMVRKLANVYPMVSAGSRLDEMIIRRK